MRLTPKMATSRETRRKHGSPLTTNLPRLTPQLRDRLLAESQQAHADRATLLTLLEQEADALRTAREKLTAVADFDVLTVRSVHSWSRADFVEAHETITDAEQCCEEVGRERQATLHTNRIPGPWYADIPLHAYLYQSLSVTHPVLADIAELADLLQTARRRIDRCRETQDRDGRRVDSRLL